MTDRWSATTVSCLLFVFLNLWAANASAQMRNWTFDFSAGGAPTVGDISNRLTSGWNVGVGGEYHVNDMLGIRGDFGYYGLGVADQALHALQMPNGDARLLSLTVGPVWHFPIARMVRGYAIGGVGWYRRTVNFTQPTIGVIDIIDPWWGYLGSAVVPANQVLGSVSDNALGANIGGGVSVALGRSGAAFFAEARYHWANTPASSTAIVPVAFGIRVGGQSVTRP
jgi:long-subunit fatty acid transport protein